MQRPGATNPRSQDSERQEEERAEEQAAEWPETGSPTRMATRRSRISRGETPGPKRRRTVSSILSSLPSLSDKLTPNRHFRSVHRGLLWRNLVSLMTSRRHYEAMPRLTISTSLKNPNPILHPSSKPGRGTRAGRRLQLGQ
jgi:hypothetical protein